MITFNILCTCICMHGWHRLSVEKKWKLRRLNLKTGFTVLSVVPLVRVHTDPVGGGGRAGRVLIKNVAIVIYDPSQATTKMIESCVYGIYMMKVKKRWNICNSDWLFLNCFIRAIGPSQANNSLQARQWEGGIGVADLPNFRYLYTKSGES